MSRTDREDALARALDILPPGDPAASDPRLLRDPALQEEARAAREAAADLWLAVSPLRAAPPDVLHSVMDKIGLPQAVVPQRRVTRLAPLLAASGWAAAAAIAICLWPRGTQIQQPGSVIAEEAPKSKASTRDEVQELAHPSHPEPDNDTQEQREIQRLKKRLASLNDIKSSAAPRIMSLTAPGMPRPSPEETNQRLSSALVEALKNSLQAQSGAPLDPASLVIQRGWLPQGLVAPDDGKTIRHLNFPEEAWREHHLLRADDGSYLDEARQIVWTREGDGSVFVGRKMSDDIDLAAYRQPDDTDKDTSVATLGGPRTAPEGFVIEDPVTNQTEVVIDQVPALAEGSQHQIVWYNAAGEQGTISLDSSSLVGGGAGAGAYPSIVSPFASNGGSAVTQYSVGGMLLYTIPNVSNLTSFQLQEVSIIPNGVPPRVIVTGGR